MVPLSVLLRDPRCAAPCEIHWAACREIRAGSTGKGGVYFTRATKSLDLVDSTGAKTTHTMSIPGKLPKK
jgi:hypothetical protein